MNRKLATPGIVATVLIVAGFAAVLVANANDGSDDQVSGEVAAEVAPIIDSGSTATTELRVGDTHTAALESSPGTGYGWQIGVEFDEGLLELVERRYECTASTSQLVGGGGQELFTFRALASGLAEFSFDYKRPWEDEVLKAERYGFNIVG